MLGGNRVLLSQGGLPHEAADSGSLRQQILELEEAVGSNREHLVNTMVGFYAMCVAARQHSMGSCA